MNLKKMAFMTCVLALQLSSHLASAAAQVTCGGSPATVTRNLRGEFEVNIFDSQAQSKLREAGYGELLFGTERSDGSVVLAGNPDASTGTTFDRLVRRACHEGKCSSNYSLQVSLSGTDLTVAILATESEQVCIGEWMSDQCIGRLETVTKNVARGESVFPNCK